MAEHTIVIRPEPAGVGFHVTVEPSPNWSRFDQERPTLRSARRYAECLRVVHRWKIRDDTGGGE